MSFKLSLFGDNSHEMSKPIFWKKNKKDHQIVVY